MNQIASRFLQQNAFSWTHDANRYPAIYRSEIRVLEDAAEILEYLDYRMGLGSDNIKAEEKEDTPEMSEADKVKVNTDTRDILPDLTKTIQRAMEFRKKMREEKAKEKGKLKAGPSLTPPLTSPVVNVSPAPTFKISGPATIVTASDSGDEGVEALLADSEKVIYYYWPISARFTLFQHVLNCFCIVLE